MLQLCPLRKITNNIKEESFLPCYEEDCAWFNKEKGVCGMAVVCSTLASPDTQDWRLP